MLFREGSRLGFLLEKRELWSWFGKYLLKGGSVNGEGVIGFGFGFSESIVRLLFVFRFNWFGGGG